MAFCGNCGVKIEEGVKFCSGCGTPVGVQQSTQVTGQAQYQQPVVQQPVVSQISTPTTDEKYCFSCGTVIKKAAEICPKCGVNQNMRNSTTAVDIYCSSCGKTIKKEASVCPFCGVSCSGSQVLSKDKKGAAITSLVLGLIGAIAWLLPLAGFPVTAVGLIMGIIGQKSTKKKMALAGIILSIIGFISTVINSAIGAYQGATGQLF